MPFAFYPSSASKQGSSFVAVNLDLSTAESDHRSRVVQFPVMLFRLSRFHAAGEVGEWLKPAVC